MQIDNVPLFTTVLNEFMDSETKGVPTFILGCDENINPIYLKLNEMQNMFIYGGIPDSRKKLYESMFLSLLTSNEPEELQVYAYDMYMRELHILSNMPHVPFNEENFKKVIDEIMPKLMIRYVKFRESGVINLADYNKVNEEKIPYIIGIFNVSSVIIPSTLESKLNKLLNFGPAVGIYTIFISQDNKFSTLSKSLKHAVTNSIEVLMYRPEIEENENENLSENNEETPILKPSLAQRFEQLKKKQEQASNTINEAILKIGEKETKLSLFNIAKDESLYFINKIKKIENISKSSGVLPLSPDEEEDYDMLKQCAYFVLSVRKASLSLIQREFSLGFNRARKILNRLTELKILVQDDNSPYKNVVGTQELIDILFSKR